MSAGTTSPSSSPNRLGLWCGMMLASIGIIAGLRFSGAIDKSTSYILLIVPFALAIQFYLSLRRAEKTASKASLAAIRYTRGMILASLGYTLGLGIAVSLWNNYALSPGVVFAISLLPALPTFGMIWVMGRYLAEEGDEYLRHRAVSAALWGLGGVLGIGTFYGFLEMFELVPHVWAWWVMPVWAIGMGLAQFAMRQGGAKGEDT